MKSYADRLSNILMEIEDRKLDAKAIIAEAHEAGIDVKALRKIAKELITDSTKLRKKLDDEQQLCLFRDAVDLLHRKGLSMKRAA